jgi:hypothetical protein
MALYSLSLQKAFIEMRKRKLPCYRSSVQPRCEELAEKIVGVSNDKVSVMGALREMYEKGFSEGYERCGFDLRYQREKREEKRQQEWIRERDKIIFRGK